MESENAMIYCKKTAQSSQQLLQSMWGKEDIFLEEEEDKFLEEEEDTFLEEEEDLLQNFDCDGDAANKNKKYDKKPSGSKISVVDHLTSVGQIWDKDSKSWVMWTIWEPNILNRLFPVSTLRTGEAYPLTMETFNEIINTGYFSICSDSSFQFLVSPLETRFAVIRLEYEKNKEPFHIRSETLEILASEMIFISGSVSFRFQPIRLMAGRQLAEILRAVCRKSDFLIISGGYKRMRILRNGKSVLLLNCKNCYDYLQVIRLPFSDADDIYMVEKIKPTTPTSLEKRFQFKYFVRGLENRMRREVTKHHNFKWVNTPEELDGSTRNFSFQEFLTPIRHHQNPYEVYCHLLSSKFQLLSPIANSFTHLANKGSMMLHPEMFHQLENRIPDSLFTRWRPSQPETNVPRGSRRLIKNASSETPDKKRRRHYERSSSPVRVQVPEPVIHPTYKRFPSIFKTFGILGALSLIYIAVMLIRFRQPCCMKDRRSYNLSSHIISSHDEYVVETTFSSIFQKFQYIIFSIGLWINEHCGLQCLLRHCGFVVQDDQFE